MCPLHKLGKIRMKIVQAIFSSGFAGSERICSDLCNELVLKHDVMLLVDKDCDKGGGDSILNHISKSVKVKKVGRFLRASRIRSLVKGFDADVYHGHLGRAVRYANSVKAPCKTVVTWHMAREYNGPNVDGVILVSNWQRSLMPDSIKATVINNWVTPFKKTFGIQAQSPAR